MSPACRTPEKVGARTSVRAAGPRGQTCWAATPGKEEAMKAIEAYDSAYPGSMHQREDGSFIRREDADSLAFALLALIKSGDRAAEDLQDALTEAKKDADLYAKKDQENYALRALVVECRSSVKFDLRHYEKMARAYGNIGPEGAQKHAMAEAEAQRLHELLAKIDALALATPNGKP